MITWGVLGRLSRQMSIDSYDRNYRCNENYGRNANG
jgi:hypothetical protein